MTFGTGTISFHTGMSAAISQFNINTERPVEMSVSDDSGYSILKLEAEATRIVNELAEKIGKDYERGPDHMKFMVYHATFYPGKVQKDNSREASADEKEHFGKIFETATASISQQMKLMVKPKDVSKIVLEQSVDFCSLYSTKRACWLRIELSQSAADRIGLNQDSKYRKYNNGPSSPGEVCVQIHPGQLR